MQFSKKDYSSQRKNPSTFAEGLLNIFAILMRILFNVRRRIFALHLWRVHLLIKCRRNKRTARNLFELLIAQFFELPFFISPLG